MRFGGGRGWTLRSWSEETSTRAFHKGHSGNFSGIAVSSWTVVIAYRQTCGSHSPSLNAHACTCQVCPSSLDLLNSGFNERVLSFSVFPVSLVLACTKTTSDSLCVLGLWFKSNLWFWGEDRAFASAVGCDVWSKAVVLVKRNQVVFWVGRTRAEA